MSIVRCERCERQIDSDEDVECFVGPADTPTCKPCRTYTLSAVCVDPDYLENTELQIAAEEFGGWIENGVAYFPSVWRREQFERQHRAKRQDQAVNL